MKRRKEQAVIDELLNAKSEVTDMMITHGGKKYWFDGKEWAVENGNAFFVVDDPPKKVIDMAIAILGA